MPRYPRSYVKTSFFHVIIQGINKEYIFNKHENIIYYIKSMYELQKEHNLKIISYCIMNNHAHFLINVNNIKELSKYMQRLNTKYARYYNKMNNRVGFVFRDRFKSEGIYSEEHLYNCEHYIYNNPVKAGICQKPEEYPYSNYRKIHHSINDSYVFIDIDDDKEILCEKIINNYLKDNNINLSYLKKDPIKAKQLVTILKNELGLSLRTISKKINYNREKIGKLYKE